MLVCVGDLVTDIVVRLEVDAIDPVSDTPAVITRQRGGSAANVAVVARRLGARARFVGALGGDDAGEGLVHALAELGVEVAGPRVDRSGSIAVIVDLNGDRRFLTDRGSHAAWGGADPGWLDGARRLHLTGYAVCDPRSTDACLELARGARSMGVAVSVDPSSVSVLTQFGPDRFRALVAEISPDIVFPNHDEWSLFEGDWGAWTRQVVTNGAGDTRVMDPDGRERRFPVAPQVVVDTTGAGDAFAAGFLVSWDADGDIDAAVNSGHAAAARVVGGVGADAWQDGSP